MSSFSPCDFDAGDIFDVKREFQRIRKHLKLSADRLASPNDSDWIAHRFSEALKACDELAAELLREQAGYDAADNEDTLIVSARPMLRLIQGGIT